MGEGAPGDDQRDEWVKGKLGEAKSKYGKYVGIKDEAEVPPAVAEEAAVEGEAPGAEQMELGLEAGDPEKEDAISKLMNQVKSVGGKKHKLSAKSE
jgi:hypothetical protein